MGQIALIVTVQVLVMALIMLGYPAALNRYVGELLGAGRSGEAHWLVNRVLCYAIPMSLAAFGILAAGSLVGGGPRRSVAPRRSRRRRSACCTRSRARS